MLLFTDEAGVASGEGRLLTVHSQILRLASPVFLDAVDLEKQHKEKIMTMKVRNYNCILIQSCGMGHMHDLGRCSKCKNAG